MNKNEKVDGMRYPSIDELLTKINSKYKLAYAAALRANDMEKNRDENGEIYTPLEDYKCAKSVGIALEEILSGDTEVTFEE